MHVIQIIPGLSEEASGPTYSVSRLCQSLDVIDMAVTLATLDFAPLVSQPQYVKTFPFGSGPRRLGRSPAMCRWLRRQCMSGHVDVVHNHGMWQMNSVYPAWARRRSGVKLVQSPRGALSPWAMRNGSLAKRVFWPVFQYRALQEVDCFHATVEAEYQDIRRLGFRQPVAIIPNGIDLVEIPAARIAKRERTLLFLGRIHTVKGLELLLSAWQAVQDNFPQWVLRIVGSDSGYHGPSGYLDFIKRKAAVLGLKRVHFAGPLYGPDKLKAFHEADLYVLPSYSENFAVTVAEALSMETPCIVSKGAPWPELEIHRAGWWFEIGVEPLVECLRDAMGRSPQDLAEMGYRGRRWMGQDYSWSNIGETMAETYRWLCDRSKPVPSCVRLD